LSWVGEQNDQSVQPGGDEPAATVLGVDAVSWAGTVLCLVLCLMQGQGDQGRPVPAALVMATVLLCLQLG